LLEINLPPLIVDAQIHQSSLQNLTLASVVRETYRGRMKLQQGQTWKCGEEFVRIVHLERLEVGYKSLKSLESGVGEHKRTSKKQFCRMLKGAALLTGSGELNQR
jgi:hypothetical protein